MGTYYSIKYFGKSGTIFKKEIDLLLVDFNNALSTYIAESEISLFNNNDSIHKFSSTYFYPVLQKSYEVFHYTKGAFDPTVMPLVNAWGFGFIEAEMPDSDAVDSLLQYVCFDSIYFDSLSIRKPKPGFMLDFSAIAKGYGVDVIAAFLRSRNIDNYLVEIGGEVACMGKNKDGKVWTIGIISPPMPPSPSESEKRRNGETEKRGRQVTDSSIHRFTDSGGGRCPVDIEPALRDGGLGFRVAFKLDNKAIATSGNYRNYYIKEGLKYAHTIDPKTGYPVEHNLLSVSVFAEDCMTADAFATAFMVVGKDKAIEIIKHRDDLEAYFIFEDDKGKINSFMTEGLEGIIIEE